MNCLVGHESRGGEFTACCFVQRRESRDALDSCKFVRITVRGFSGEHRIGIATRGFKQSDADARCSILFSSISKRSGKFEYGAGQTFT